MKTRRLFSIRFALLLSMLIALCTTAAATQPPVTTRAAARSFTLVLDAGHGGHDSGAVGAYSKEKDINLNVALAVGRLVRDNCPDVKIVYTRQTDVFIPLQQRADIANNAKADLFISIHTNALPAGRIARGSETYSLGMARAGENLAVAKRENAVITLERDYKQTYEGFDPNRAESYVIFEIMQDKYMKQSVDLAGQIQKQYAAAGRPNKGVHQAGFLVLRKTSMPAVLTELGFITTPDEERYLNSAQGIEELSRSIYNGFLAYRRLHDKTAHDLPANLPTHVNTEAPALSPSARTDGNATPAEPAVTPVETVPTAAVAPPKEEGEKDKEDLVAPKEEESKPKADVAKPKGETPKPKGEAAKPKAAPPAPKADAKTKKETPAAPKDNAKEGKGAAAKKAASTAKESEGTKKKAEGTMKKAEDTKKKSEGTTKKSAAEDKKSSSNSKKTAASEKKSRVSYRIQVGAGKAEIPTNDKQFAGLAVERVKEGSLYKYFYGNYTRHADAQAALKKVKEKLSAAYIVAYIDGHSATVSEARNKEKEK